MRDSNDAAVLEAAGRRHHWISIPRMEEILSCISSDIADACDSDDKPIIVLSGPTGIGKTTLLRELSFRLGSAAVPPRSHDQHFRFKPFVHSTLSTGATPAQIAIDIRLSMGLPTPSTFFRMAQQKCREGLNQLSVQILAVDHVNAILNHGARAQQDCLNVLKFLSVTAPVPLILSGTMPPEQLFTGLNDPAGEMASRAVYYRLEAWKPDANFQQLILALGEAYAIDEPEVLASQACATVIHQGSLGLTRLVCRSIRQASQQAKHEGCQLQPRHLEAALRRMSAGI